jgi:hypothetical protein
MALIGVSGYSSSGKDTIGLIVQYIFSMDKQGASIEQVCADPESHAWWLEEQSGWEVRKFAGKLKDIASHLTGIDIEKFEDQEFKNKTFKQLVKEGYMSQDVLNLLTKT